MGPRAELVGRRRFAWRPPVSLLEVLRADALDELVELSDQLFTFRCLVELVMLRDHYALGVQQGFLGVDRRPARIASAIASDGLAETT